MLSLNQTFDDTRAIKILVVPIGENSLFESHFNVVSRLRDMPLYELNRPSTWKTQNQACKHFNWNNGNLLFEYLRYDRVPNGPGDLDNFQPSRRVLMIMGLINYPELGNADIDKQLSYFSRRHENVLLCRVFVFNYSFENSVPLKGPSGDPNSLIIFPPEGECEGGSMVAVHLQEVMSHAGVKFIESLNKQLLTCEDLRARNSAVLPSDLILTTRHDDMDDPPGADGWSGAVDGQVSGADLLSGGNAGGGGAGGTSSGNGNTPVSTVSGSSAMTGRSFMSSAPPKPPGTAGVLGKRKIQERLRKWMGDLSLQSCSPIDAIEHYQAAITDARLSPRTSPGDRMWLAGALEGFTAAVLLLLKLGLPVEDVLGKELRQYALLSANSSNFSSNLEGNNSLESSNSNSNTSANITPEKELTLRAMRLAEDRANEALNFYSRNIVFFALEVECSLRLARMHEAGIEWNKEQKALEYIMRAAAVPGLNPQQQVECILEGGLIARRLGLRRKYALFLYIAALMMADNDNATCAHGLIRNACAQYGIATSLRCDRGFPYSGAGLHCVGVDAGRDGQLEDDEDQESNEEMATMLSSRFIDCLQDKVIVRDPDASWIGMRRALLAYSAHTAMESHDHQAASRYVAALMRLMMQIESVNCRQYGLWVNYVQHCMRQLSEGTNNYPGSGDGGRSSSGWFPTVHFGPSAEAYGFVQRRGSRILAQEVVDRLSNSPGPRGGSVTSTNPGNNLFSPPQNTSHQIFASPFNTGYVPLVEYQTTTPASNPFSAAAEAFRGVTGGNGGEATAALNEVAHAAGAIRDGLRRIAAPQLPPKIVQLVRNGRQSLLQNNLKKQRSATVYSNRDELVTPKKPLMKKKDKDGLHQTSSSFQSLPAGGSNPAEELILSLQMMLEAACIPLDQQEDAVGMLEHLSRQLDPGCAILLPIPVISLRPHRQPKEYLRPFRLVPESNLLTEQLILLRLTRNTSSSGEDGPDKEQTVEGKKSALFYDPFETKRNRDRQNKNPTETLWQIGCNGNVEVLLKNPLSVSLRIDAMRLILEGSQHEALFAEDIEIPAFSTSFPVTLSVKPLECGSLQVIGVLFSMNNAIMIANFDETGKVITTKPEVSSIWKYPRPATNSVKKLAGLKDAKNIVQATISTSVLVVPQSAALKLVAGWQSGRHPISQHKSCATHSYSNAVLGSSGSSSSCSSSSGAVFTSLQDQDSDRPIQYLSVHEGEVRRESIILQCMNTEPCNVGDIRLTVTQTVLLPQSSSQGSANTANNPTKQAHCVQTKVLRPFSRMNCNADPKALVSAAALKEKVPAACGNIPFLVTLVNDSSGVDSSTVSPNNDIVNLPATADSLDGTRLYFDVKYFPGLCEVLFEVDVVDEENLNLEAFMERNESIVPVYSRRSSLKVLMDCGPVVKVNSVTLLRLEDVQKHVSSIPNEIDGGMLLNSSQLSLLHQACVIATSASKDSSFGACGSTVGRGDDVNKETVVELKCLQPISHLLLEVRNNSAESLVVASHGTDEGWNFNLGKGNNNDKTFQASEIVCFDQGGSLVSDFHWLISPLTTVSILIQLRLVTTGEATDDTKFGEINAQCVDSLLRHLWWHSLTASNQKQRIFSLKSGRGGKIYDISTNKNGIPLTPFSGQLLSPQFNIKLRLTGEGLCGSCATQESHCNTVLVRKFVTLDVSATLKQAALTTVAMDVVVVVSDHCSDCFTSNSTYNNNNNNNSNNATNCNSELFGSANDSIRSDGLKELSSKYVLIAGKLRVHGVPLVNVAASTSMVEGEITSSSSSFSSSFCPSVIHQMKLCFTRSGSYSILVAVRESNQQQWWTPVQHFKVTATISRDLKLL